MKDSENNKHKKSDNMSGTKIIPASNLDLSSNNPVEKIMSGHGQVYFNSPDSPPEFAPYDFYHDLRQIKDESERLWVALNFRGFCEFFYLFTKNEFYMKNIDLLETEIKALKEQGYAPVKPEVLSDKKSYPIGDIVSEIKWKGTQEQLATWLTYAVDVDLIPFEKWKYLTENFLIWDKDKSIYKPINPDQFRSTVALVGGSNSERVKVKNIKDDLKKAIPPKK